MFLRRKIHGPNKKSATLQGSEGVRSKQCDLWRYCPGVGQQQENSEKERAGDIWNNWFIYNIQYSMYIYIYKYVNVKIHMYLRSLMHGIFTYIWLKSTIKVGKIFHTWSTWVYWYNNTWENMTYRNNYNQQVFKRGWLSDLFSNSWFNMFHSHPLQKNAKNKILPKFY